VALPDILFILPRDQIDLFVPGEKLLDICRQPFAATIIQADAIVPA
jgi:hypothetical protein